jgi:hypothetical protein
MTLEEGLLNNMLTDANIIAKVSNRVWVSMMPIQTKLPAIMFVRGKAKRMRAFNTCNLVSCMIFFNVWGRNATEAIQISEVVRKAYDNKSGNFDSIRILGMFLQDESDIYEDELKAFGRLLTFEIIYAESNT